MVLFCILCSTSLSGSEVNRELTMVMICDLPAYYLKQPFLPLKISIFNLSLNVIVLGFWISAFEQTDYFKETSNFYHYTKHDSFKMIVLVCY